ncbi:hypothetical protein LTS08_007387 [Lithohypha guttulata]|nr:hypothetical protein LTS08_007387 [Lithohypha guttulata]
MSSKFIKPILTRLGLGACLKPRKQSSLKPATYEQKSKFGDEKPAYDTFEAADRFVTTLIRANYRDSKDLNLRAELKNAVSANSWSENLAKTILERLELAIRSGAAIGGTVSEALLKATEAATGFAKDHPVYTTIIVLGVLCLAAPWVLQALGFAEIGIVEGSWAALWQARYAGYVPKSSLFAYLQRLGMVLKWKL